MNAQKPRAIRHATAKRVMALEVKPSAGFRRHRLWTAVASMQVTLWLVEGDRRQLR